MTPDDLRSDKGDRSLTTLNSPVPSKSGFLRWFQESAIFLSSTDSRKQLQQTILHGRSGGIAAGLGGFLLLLWNAKLVFSTGAGMGAMILLYLFQDKQWLKEQLPQLNAPLQRQLEGVNRPFLWSAIGGMGTAFLSYLAIAVWLEMDSHWLATGIVLQGMALTGILGLGIRQWLIQKQETNHIKTLEFSHWVEKLSHEDPVSRLLAVRQLTTIAQSALLVQQKELLEYFQLMVVREPEELVCEAIWQGLETLSPSLNLLSKTELLSNIEDEFVPEQQKKIRAWVENEEY